MSFDLERLYKLLPAIYRIRDLEQQTGDASLLGGDVSGDTNANKPARPLYALMSVLAEQIAVLEENLAQLYDDQFIETSAEWAIPYIGDLVGYQLPQYASSQSLRSDVANTIRYRKRKGTVTLLEQLARDVTGWDTHVVEYFPQLAATQHKQRLQPSNRRLIDVRQIASPSDVYPLSPFQTLPHGVEVRNIATGDGRYNIPNIGIFIWRLQAYRLSDVPLVEAPVHDADRYLYYLNPLAVNMQLFTYPQHEEDVTQLAGPLAVAAPITRTMLARAFDDYYGHEKSLWLTETGGDGSRQDILPDPLEKLARVADELHAGLTAGRLDFPRLALLSETLYKGLASLPHIAYLHLVELIINSQALYESLNAVETLDFRALTGLVQRSADVASGLKALRASQEIAHPSYAFTVADLSDEQDEDGRLRWKASPEDAIALDPELGRAAFPRYRRGRHKRAEHPKDLHATFYYGFSTAIGGGEYYRAGSFSSDAPVVQRVAARIDAVQAALDALIAQDQDGVIEITDSGRMDGVLRIDAGANQRIELRAADYARPLLVLTAKEGSPTLEVSGAAGAEVTLNGLVIAGGTLHVTGDIQRFALRHCTLVPANEQRVEGPPGLLCDAADAIIEIDHAITGRIEIMDNANVLISNSIVDAGRDNRLAYAGPPSFLTRNAELDTLSIDNSTIIGRVHTSVLQLASNTIFYARHGEHDAPPVQIERRQEGCVRYSYLPPGSHVPQRRYHCQPEAGADVSSIGPHFTSLMYGEAGYAQLSKLAGDGIGRGADDGAEMGAFHDLFQPQRASNLNLRLNEYLRFGFEVGTFFMT